MEGCGLGERHMVEILVRRGRLVRGRIVGDLCDVRDVWKGPV
jgi:hypothetical protein